MEVTNVRDHVTHAIVGGGKAEACGISDSAEFFHILSSTLYSDKMLAVVREVLCNAWDAHVFTGIENIAVDVTLTDKVLVFRDYGEGIHRDLIRDIYGVYGGSTKKSDKRQTGGFGLGSKAPWAYVDHFQVTSCHQGEKTIYNMSKSSAQVNGKPMITPIVTVPTDDSGLEVSINLKDPSDQRRFRELITRLAALGEMNVKLNGEKLATVPFSEAKNGYLIFSKKLMNENSRHDIFVRYGHVVYPIEHEHSYSSPYNRILRMLRDVNGVSHYSSAASDWILAVQAEPDTISVTPSRESLSMTEHTIATLNQLLVKAAQNMDGKLEAMCEKLTLKTLETVPLFISPVRSLTDMKQDHLHTYALPEPVKKVFVTSFDELSGAYMRRHYPRFEGFWQKDQRARLDALENSGFGPQALIKSYFRELKHLKSIRRQRSDWFHRHFLWPLMRRMKNTTLDPKRLFLYDSGYRHNDWAKRHITGSFAAPNEIKRQNHLAYLPYLRGFVMLTHSRMAIEERAEAFPAMRHWFGQPDKGLVYVVQRNPERVKQAIAYWERQGFYVLDLTKYHKWETWHEVAAEEKKIERAAIVKKPKPKGFPLLSSALSSKGNLSTELIYAEDNPTRTEKVPEFVIVIGERAALEGLESYNAEVSRAFIRLYGDKGVVVRNSIQARKLKDLGAIDFKDYFNKKVADEVENNPQVKNYFQNSVHGWTNSSFVRSWNEEIIKEILRDDVLRKEFKLPPRVDTRTLDVIRIISGISQWEWHYAPLEEVSKTIKKWGPSPALQLLFNAVSSSSLISIFAPDSIAQIRLGNDAQAQNTVRKFILTVLKG